jgi:hypothetical protein
MQVLKENWSKLTDFKCDKHSLNILTLAMEVYKKAKVHRHSLRAVERKINKMSAKSEESNLSNASTRCSNTIRANRMIDSDFDD